MILVKRFNQDKIINENGEQLVELCKTSNLSIINGRIGKDFKVGSYTFENNQGNSTIDYAIISAKLYPYVVDFEVDILDQCLSDFHHPIILTLENHTIEKYKHVEEVEMPSDINFLPIHSRWDPEKINEYKSNFDIDKYNFLLETLESLIINGPDQNGVDNIVNELCKLYINPALNIGISKPFTERKYKNNKLQRKNKPGFDRECLERRRQYFRIRDKLRKSKSYRGRLLLKNETKSYKKFIRYKLNTYCRTVHEKLRTLKSKNPKEYWKIINPSKSPRNNSIDISSLHDHFKNLMERNNSTSNNFNANNIMLEDNDDINFDFTLEEINDLVDDLKNNKANGIDNVINEFIKYSPKELRNVLVVLFNIILNSGIIPSDWCISLISPLYKNTGPKDEANNYRGISLISCIGKLFTALINKRLELYIKNNQLLGEEQAGFRPNYSTTDHIFVLNSVIDLYLNKF